MKKGILIICILAPFLLGMACNKDKERVAELENEVRQDEANNIEIDSLRVSDSVNKMPDSSLTPNAEVKSEIEFTPDLTPDENYSNTTEKKPMVKTMDEARTQVADKSRMPIKEDKVDGYTIQIGSGIDRADAEELMKEYIDKGYISFISERIAEGVTYYRVRIGHFSNIDEARQLGLELKNKYSIDYWIDKIQ